MDGIRIDYTPAVGFVGTETFQYTINDGTPGSDATAQVTVNVGPVSQYHIDIVFVDDGLSASQQAVFAIRVARTFQHIGHMNDGHWLACVIEHHATIHMVDRARGHRDDLFDGVQR